MLRIRDVYPGSRFLPIPDPGSRIPDLGSRISDPKTATKETGEKFFFQHFFVATNFTNCKIILLLNCSRKKFQPNFKELWNVLPKKLSLSSQKYEFGIRDPRSGINLFRIPGSKRQRIPDPDPQHWDPGSRMSDPGSQIHIFESLVTKFWVKGSIIL